VHLVRDQASEIASCFTERLRNDVLLRIETLDGIQPTALSELDDVLTGLLSGSDNLKRAPMGGIRSEAEILNFMTSVHEEAVIENFKQYDP
ncbi:flagellar motor switch protein FliG, partial [Burkholderia pseudomallei]